MRNIDGNLADNSIIEGEDNKDGADSISKTPGKNSLGNGTSAGGHQSSQLNLDLIKEMCLISNLSNTTGRVKKESGLKRQGSTISTSI